MTGGAHMTVGRCLWRLLLLLYGLNPAAIALCVHITQRHKPQAGAVDAIAFAATVTRAIGENMPQVRVCMPAAYFNAVHVVAGVDMFGDHAAGDGPYKAGPATAGIVLVGRAEQRLAADNVHIQTPRKQAVVC